MKLNKIVVVLLCVLLVFGVFSCTKKSRVEIKTVEDLKGLRIGVQAGTTGEGWCAKNVEDVKIVSFKTGIDAALDLVNGAIDAIVLDELPAKEIVEKNPKLTIVKDRFAREEYAIAVRKGSDELLKSINETITAMRNDGSYEQLINAFMPADGNIVIPEIESEGDGVLKLGTNSAFPPFEYVDGQEVVGFDITMGQKIAANYGKKLQVIDMNFDSLIGALQSGAIDFIAAGMSVTEDRKQNVDFSLPYFESEQVIIIKK
ncbi:MAG: transporter substrate-binding domain-containing protein [Treponemataceae bacterium]